MRPVLLFAAVALSVVACLSPKTWPAFEVHEKEMPKGLRKELGNFVLIEGGAFHSGKLLGSDTFTHLLKDQRIAVGSFYMQKTEVTVKEYMEFCRASGDSRNYPDTNVFNFFIGQPIMSLFFSHPKYQDYPMVGVDRDQVQRYILWKTEQLQAVMKEHPKPKAWYTLPLDTEMEFAMQGVKGSSKYENVISPNWAAPWFVNPDLNRWNTGNVWDENGVQLKHYTSDGYFFSAPVRTMKPNEFGLFHICGNVAEWTRTSVKERYLAFEDSSVIWHSDTCVSGIPKGHDFNPYRNSGDVPQRDTLWLNSTSARVLRDSGYYMVKGGSWYHSPFYTQSASFLCVHQQEKHGWMGFRLVLRVYRNRESTP